MKKHNASSVAEIHTADDDSDYASVQDVQLKSLLSGMNGYHDDQSQSQSQSQTVSIIPGHDEDEDDEDRDYCFDEEVVIKTSVNEEDDEEDEEAGSVKRHTDDEEEEDDSGGGGSVQYKSSDDDANNDGNDDNNRNDDDDDGDDEDAENGSVQYNSDEDDDSVKLNTAQPEHEEDGYEDEDGSVGGGSVQLNDAEQNENWVNEDFDTKSIEYRTDSDADHDHDGDDVDKPAQVAPLETLIADDNHHDDDEHHEQPQTQTPTETTAEQDSAILPLQKADADRSGRDRRLQSMKEHKHYKDYGSPKNENVKVRELDELKHKYVDRRRHRETMELLHDDDAGFSLGDLLQGDDKDDEIKIDGISEKQRRSRYNTKDDDDDDDDDEENEDDESWSSYDRRDGADDDEEDDDDEDGDEDDDEEDAADKGDDAVGMEAATAVQVDDYLKQALGAFDEETLAAMRVRSFWVKKSKKKKKVATAKDKRRLLRMLKVDDAKKDDAKKDDAATADKKAAAVTAAAAAAGKEKKEKRVKQRHTAKWSVSRIREVFADVLSNRGKSGVNREQIVSRLEELQEQCELHGAEQARLTIISVLISFYFETAERKTSGMSGSRWRNTRTLLTQMLRSLSKNIDTLRVSNDADLKLTLKEDKKEDETGEEQTNVAWMQAIKSVEETDVGGGGIRPGGGGIRPGAPKATVAGGGDMIGDDSSGGGGGVEASARFGRDFNSSVIQMSKKKKLDAKYQWIQGNVLNFIKKLSNELWTNLKSLEPRSEQYENRRKNILLLLKTYKQTVFYFSKLADTDAQSEVEVLWMHAIHNDYDESIDGVLERQRAKEHKQATAAKLLKMKNVWFRGHKIVNLPQCEITRKAIYVFEHGSTRNQTCAMIYLIYCMALHHRFELCRDLLLMSHLGSSTRIGGTHIDLQVLYNRALAQFAICAFCSGHWYSAMIILQEMFASNRLKILLGQGYIKAGLDNPTSEMIKQEQEQYARMLPYHFHIQMDALEASHLLSSLFIEIPNMISNAYNKSWIRNQYFRKIWHQYLRRDLRVPPENTKDYILSIGIHAHNGEWMSAKAMVNKLKIWHEIKHTKLVKKQVYSTLKRQCLRCYLYRYGCVYDTISIPTLSEMFELSARHCKQFIAKLIVTAGNDARFASIDELTQCVVMHQLPPMPVQRTALEYSDKLSFLIEQNEKLLGIYSRFSAWGGGKQSKGKGKGGYKDGDKDGDKKDGGKKQDGKKGNYKTGGGGGGGRFGRSGGNNSAASANKAGAQFGRRQYVQAQIRSVRPRT